MKIFLIAIVLILLVFSPALAENRLNGEIWLGQICGSQFPANPDFLSAAKYSSGIELGYTFDIQPISLRPYTRINIYMDEKMGYNFHPAGGQFYDGIELIYKHFFLQFEHMCWHPIDAEGHVYQYDMFRIGIKFGDR